MKFLPWSLNTGQSVTILGSLKGIMCNLCLTKIVTNYVKASKKITVLFFLFKAYFNTCQNQKKIMTLSFMKQLRADVSLFSFMKAPHPAGYRVKCPCYDCLEKAPNKRIFPGVNLDPWKNLNFFDDEIVLIALKIHPTW